MCGITSFHQFSCLFSIRPSAKNCHCLTCCTFGRLVISKADASFFPTMRHNETSNHCSPALYIWQPFLHGHSSLGSGYSEHHNRLQYTCSHPKRDRNFLHATIMWCCHIALDGQFERPDYTVPKHRYRMLTSRKINDKRIHVYRHTRNSFSTYPKE